LRALLLAAGLGMRLRPLTNTVPKCLVPIRGRPLLDYWVELLCDAGIERVLVNTHHLANEVTSFVNSSRWRKRIDLVHEPALLGTGGTVLANRHWLGRSPFLVAHADNLTRFDPRAFIERHLKRPAGCVITIMTFETDTPQSCGIIEERADGVVVAFHEKVPNPPGRRANGAIYIFEPEVSDFLVACGKPVIDLSTEVIPHFLGRICTFHNAWYHRDIGTIESLRRAEAEFPSD
jgi:mannose-1-phosphate guanylyltransferase